MKEMSRELEYYYKNREKISEKRKTKEFAEKRRKYQSEFNKTCRRSRKILIEIEDWIKDMITPKPLQGGGLGFVQSINPELVLDKIQELKEKYK